MKDHINTAFPEEKRPMMYKMMKWWGGKPHNIWSEYIARYSNEGDVVLDPFCGRGVGVIEAVRNRRRAIGMDLNPIAIYQAKMISADLDIPKFTKYWNELKNRLQNIEIESGFFYTTCTNCNKKTEYTTVNRTHDEPYQIVYRCTCKKKYQTKKLDDEDYAQIHNSDLKQIQTPYPKDTFPNTSACKQAIKNYGKTYDKLFTNRNLYALSTIFENINQIDDDDMKHFFRFAFISMVHLASKIPSVRRSRLGSGSWGRPGYIKLKNRMELNPYILFQRAVEGNQGIIAGKKSSNKRLQSRIKYAANVDKFYSDNDTNLLLLKKNTLEISNILNENSIDFIITDPPYGGLIPYFDLSFIWSVWLKLIDKKFAIYFNDEVTIDKERKFDFNEYHRRLSMVFEQLHKLLKDDKYMIVTFHNDKPIIFNSILRVCQDAGFVLEKILFQVNLRPGETGAATPWGTSVSDFYMRFKKPKNGSDKKLLDFIEEKFENIVTDAAKHVLLERGEPSQIAAMIPHIYGEMTKTRMKIHFSSDEQIYSILERNADFIKTHEDYWWLNENIVKKSKINIIPLSDRVEETVLNTLQQKYKVTYDEILKNIFEKFQNSLTPNTENVKRYLNEFGVKSNNGMWTLKLGMAKDEVSSMHTEMELLLLKIGKQFNYDVWSPDKSKKEEMKNICIDFNLQLENKDRIRLIDVLWIKDNKIKYAFEVENSTSMTSALERGSNIKDQNVRKIITIPKERKGFFDRKIQEPLFHDYFINDNWNVVLYDELKTFDTKHKKSEKLFIELLKKI